ncbi:MAG: hypothetical protein AAF431_13355 [Pseudomonadota bacterium]
MRLILNTCVIAICCLVGSSWAQSETDPGSQLNYSPVIQLFSFDGGRTLNQAATDPLLLFAILDNPNARYIQRENARNQKRQEQYEASEDYKKLPEKMAKFELAVVKELYPVLEIPKIKLGNDKARPDALINFQVKNQEGENVDLNISALPANEDETGSTELHAENSLYYQFGVSQEDLKALVDGTYQIVAVLDSKEQTDMWQGSALSKPIVVTLSREHPEADWAGSNQQAILHSNYLMASHQYLDAELHARSWIERHPDSIDGWAQLGDALAAQNKNEEARTSWETALAKFRLKYGDNPVELPMEIIDRIDELEADQN